MKSEISERATGSEQARETDMLRRGRETDGGRKGERENRAYFESKLYQYHGP